MEVLRDHIASRNLEGLRRSLYLSRSLWPSGVLCSNSGVRMGPRDMERMACTISFAWKGREIMKQFHEVSEAVLAAYRRCHENGAAFSLSSPFYLLTTAMVATRYTRPMVDGYGRALAGWVVRRPGFEVPEYPTEKLRFAIFGDVRRDRLADRQFLADERLKDGWNNGRRQSESKPVVEEKKAVKLEEFRQTVQNQVLFYIRGSDVPAAVLDIVAAMGGSRRTVEIALTRLVRKKLIQRVTRGFYGPIRETGT